MHKNLKIISITEICEWEIDEVLAILKENLDRCIYSYIDLFKYRKTNPDFTAYLVKDSKNHLLSVLTEYYDSVQICDFSNAGDAVANTIYEFVTNNGIKVIFGEFSIIEAMSRLHCGINAEYGYVAKYKSNYHLEKRHWNHIETAKTYHDFEEISNLICSDVSMGKTNEQKQLSVILKSRSESSFGRSVIIRSEGDIVAHASTNAELPGISVIGGVITRFDYRGKGYGSSLVSYLCDRLHQEEKSIYLFWYNEEAFRIYKKLGFGNVEKWGKMVIKQ